MKKGGEGCGSQYEIYNVLLFIPKNQTIGLPIQQVFQLPSDDLWEENKTILNTLFLVI